MSANKPLVSVLMIAYNQADYIQQALTSVLDQICRFEFEVILSNDASSDNSDKLISDIIINHSNGFRVRYFNQPINLGMNSNFAFAYEKCKGKYIAICEGDDYWTDCFKLQKQVEFLEENSDFSICYHSVNVFFPNGIMEEDYGIKGKIEGSESNIYDLVALGNYIHTPSVVFRKVFDDIPQNLLLAPIGDYFIWILIAKSGKIKKLSDKMSVYRYGVGVHSGNSNIKKLLDFVRTLELISNTVEDVAISQIIKYRIQTIKSNRLPSKVKNLEDYSLIINSKIFSDFIPLTELIKAIGIKLKRKFLW